MKRIVSIVCVILLLCACLFSCAPNLEPNPQINEPEEIYGLQIGMHEEEWEAMIPEDADTFETYRYYCFTGEQEDIVILRKTDIEITCSGGIVWHDIEKIWSCEKPPERSKAYLKRYVHEGMTFAELVAIAGMPVGESGSGVSIIAFPLKEGGTLQTWWYPSEDDVSDCLSQFKFS